MAIDKRTANQTNEFFIKAKIFGVICLGLIVMVSLLFKFKSLGYERHIQKQQEVTDRLIKDLNFYITKMEGITQRIAKNSYVIERLQPSPTNISPKGDVNRDILTVLYSIQLVSQSSIVYLLNAEGVVIASTTYDNNQTLTGANYRFRPYFTQAMKKKNAIYAALGVTTGKRGLYFSSPVIAHGNDVPVGVIVIKMGMESIDQLLANFPDIAGIMSPEGIIFASNLPAWMYKVSLPISNQRIAQLRQSQQFGKQPLMPLPVFLNTEGLTIQNEAYTLVKNKLAIPDWLGFSVRKINSTFPLFMGLSSSVIILLLTLLLSLNIINTRKKKLFESEKKNATEEIRVQNDFLHTVLDSLSHPFYIINIDDYSIVMANRAAGDFSSFVQERVTCYYITHGLTEPCRFDSQEFSCPVEKIKATKQPVVLEHRHKSADGKISYHVIHAYPIFNEEGRLIRMIEYNVDITSRKHMEEELLKKRQLESIGILAGGIAHDFNNLLAVIIGNIEMVKDDMPENGQHHKCLESAERNAIKAAELSKKLISFSRTGWLERTSIHLPTLIKEIIDNDFDKQAVHFNSNFHDDLFLVNADERQLSQALQNIFQNALDAVENIPEAEISISAENVAEDDTTIIEQLQPLGRDPHSGFINITVTDPGKGIPKENISKVFDPYFTTKSPCSEKGVGLGLTICYSIVKKHGGLIKIHSEVGHGTSIDIYLPAYSNDQVPVKA